MIKIYTDGSCLKNPGDGGWAAIISKNGENIEISGSEKDTTNNRMELTAPIMALKKIKESGHNVSMLVSHNNASFTKKATGRIVFECNQGKDIDAACGQLANKS